MRYEYYKLHENQIKIPIPECYKDCWVLIKSDMFRISGKVESSLSIIKSVIKPFNSTILFWLRLCQYRGLFWRLCWIMYMRACKRYQVQIPITVKIGYGFYIGHGMCMIVNWQTVIGNNVNLSQFLNIGTNRNMPAIIGDNVYIAPHVSIVEDVKVGNNSTIGTGAVVTQNVPEGATVVGVPAKVINYNDPGRYVERRWKIPQ